MADKINFKKGSSKLMPKVVNGQILFTTDTHNLYIDDGNRHNQINANRANSLVRTAHLTTADAMNKFIKGNEIQYGTFKLSEDSFNLGFGSNDGMILSMPWSSAAYGLQLAIDDSTTPTIAFRGKSTSWGSWYKLLDSKNYKKYVTPANIGAATSSHDHNSTYLSLSGGSISGALTLNGSLILNSSTYGTAFPTTGLTKGQIFFKKA